MENYILRIYRRDETHPDRVVGLLEDVENGVTLPFANLAELMSLLSRRECLQSGTRDLELA